MLIRMVGGWVFIPAPAHPGSPGQRAVKRTLLLLCCCSLAHNNEITLHRARLVLRWVIVRRHMVLVCNQPLRPTQPPTLSEMGYQYWPRGSGSVLRRPGRWPTSSLLPITDRSICSAPCLWYQLPVSLRQPHQSLYLWLTFHVVFLCWFTACIFHCRLKTHAFHKSFPP